MIVLKLLKCLISLYIVSQQNMVRSDITFNTLCISGVPAHPILNQINVYFRVLFAVLFCLHVRNK